MEKNLTSTKSSLQIEGFEAVDLSKVTTLQKAIEVRTPALSAIKKHKGESMAVNILSAHILSLHSSLNITNSMNEDQIKEASKLLLSEYWMLTIADLSAIFASAKLGKFGEIYNRLDVSILSKWFADYLTQRTNTYSLISEQKHKETKNKDDERHSTEFYNRI